MPAQAATSPLSCPRNRIAAIFHRFPELSQTFVLDQLTALRDADFDVRVFAARLCEEGLQHEKAGPLVETGNFAIDARPRRSFGRGLLSSGLAGRRQERAVETLYRRAAEESDLLLCHFGPNGLRAAAATRGLEKPAPIWTVFHGYDMSSYLDMKGPDAYAFLFQEGDRFLPISRKWAGKLVELGCPAERIQLLRMGVDCDRIPFLPPAEGRGEPLRLFTVGRLTEKKGTAYSLRALARLQSEDPRLDWTFEVIGDGPLRDGLVALARSLGIGERVSFLGAMSTEEVSARLRKADMFLLPSVVASDGDMEGIPVALMEAMSAGVPVVSTFHSGIPELVEPDVSGLLAPERDVEALYRHIQSMAGDLSRRRALAQAARVKVEAEFNQAKIHAELVASIRDRLES